MSGGVLDLRSKNFVFYQFYYERSVAISLGQVMILHEQIA